MKTEAQKYSLAGGAAVFATTLATRVPGLKELPPEISIPVVLAAIRFITDLIKKRFGPDNKK